MYLELREKHYRQRVGIKSKLLVLKYHHDFFIPGMLSLVVVTKARSFGTQECLRMLSFMSMVTETLTSVPFQIKRLRTIPV